MKKIFLLLLPLIAFCRLNPFKPVITPQNTLVVKPHFFREAKIYLNKDARVLKKIVFVYQNVDGDIKKQSVKINKNIDFHSPIIILHKPKNFPVKEISYKFLKIFIENRKIIIKTKDRLIRSFFLIAPFRIVLDFKKYSDFATFKKKLNSFVKKVVIGSHGDFYRIVFYFDSKYEYKIKKDKGIIIELK